MRLPRSSARLPTASAGRQNRCSLLSSWQSIGFLGLALTQLVSFYLLANFAGRQVEQEKADDGAFVRYFTGHQDVFSTGETHGHTTILTPTVEQLASWRPDNVLSVVRSNSSPSGTGGVTAAQECITQMISAGQCSNEMKGLSRPQELRRETCAFDLDASDVVFGVWHSLATEKRLQPLLDTWGAQTNVVLLASTVGARESKLFKPGMAGSKPHLLDTGILEDDYFSTLGKAFVGLRLMLEAYPSKKWFVVLGDDNYVLMDNYVNALSAFDPDQPWALSRMVYREKFGCKVAGGASVITSRGMTQELAPHLEPWYQDIWKRSGGDVTKASQEDKFHDIAFQKLVEARGHTWVHLDELPHEPPGFYFDPRLAQQKGGLGIPARSALFHYVPGKYMHYLHFVSSQACTCILSSSEKAAALSQVAVGVYSQRRRLSKLDEKRIAATWGQGTKNFALLSASGPDMLGLRGDVERIRELSSAFPDTGWLLLLPVDHYVVPANLAMRIRKLEEQNAEEGGRSVMISGPGRRVRQENEGGAVAGTIVEFAEGALLLGQNLAKTILEFGPALSGGVFPTRRRPGDREIFAWARTINRSTVLEDPGLLRRLPEVGGTWEGRAPRVGCPATFPMDPDLADLKPEFTMSEGDAVLPVTKFLLNASPDKTCSVNRRL